MNYPNDSTLEISRYKSPKNSVVGRLIAMPSTPNEFGTDYLQKIAGYKNVIAFDFPAMPDAIELARSTEYVVQFNPIMPDGMHQYRGTRPLEIPLSFRLHAMDTTFCPKGSLTLLQLAARLHSFILPMSSDGQRVTATPVRAGELVAKYQGKERETQLQKLGYTSEDQLAYDSNMNSNVYRLTSTKANTMPYPPVTCFLNLIWVAADQPGISCIGYVKDVRVRLLGPWLRGRDGESFNLPSAGEFEFTFVHRPSHRNDWGTLSEAGFANSPADPEMQAFATDVRDRLFNTRDLVLQAGYVGYEGANPKSTGAAIAPTATRSGGADASSTIPHYVPEG